MCIVLPVSHSVRAQLCLAVRHMKKDALLCYDLMTWYCFCEEFASFLLLYYR